MTLLKTFESKRNSVCLIEEDSKVFIRKTFSDKADYLREIKNYKLIEVTDIRVAKVQNIDPKTLSIELDYIEGKTLLKCLEELEERDDSDGAINLLLCLFNRFEKLKKQHGLYYEDINLRNFLVNEKEIYLIDLEAIKEGYNESIMPHTLAYYLLYDPIETPFKKKVVDGCLLALKQVSLKDEIEKEVKKILLRRIGNR